MQYELSPYNPTTWSFNGKSVERLVIVPRANCAPAKEVVDQTCTLITSECISLDTCAPKIKSYHKHASSYTVKETIPGIGLGCDMISGSNSVTRRHQPSDAGNFILAPDVADYMYIVMNQLKITGDMIGAAFFPDSAAIDIACPRI